MNNKIVVLGIAFILVFTLNIFSNDSHASLTPLYQMPITLYNSQNVSTPNPFQELIYLNINQINQDLLSLNVSANLIYNYSFANFEFSYSSGQIIPAWVEINNSGVLLIWLKITEINAKSSIVIYLDIFSSTVNLLSASGPIGENPLVSKIYAEFDNGASVFDFYDNFIGNSLNGNNWVYGGSGSIIVDNGVTLKSNSYIYIITKNGFIPSATICDVQGSLSTANKYVVFSMTNGNSNNSNGYFWIYDATYSYSNGSYSHANGFLGGLGEFIPGDISSISWQSSVKQIFIINYGNSPTYYNQSLNSYLLPSEVFYGIGVQYVSGGTNSIQYLNVSFIDVRAFPPNGVMPTAYFDVGLNVSVSYPSGNSNSSTNYPVIYPQYNATSENLQFNSQYFSFIIDPLFIFSLLLFLSLIFFIFMAIALVKKRR